LKIAFERLEESDFSITLDYVVDLLFLLDILVVFNTAYYDEDVDLVDDRKQIAKNYLKGWFTIDLLAIIPFDKIISSA